MIQGSVDELKMLGSISFLYIITFSCLRFILFLVIYLLGFKMLSFILPLASVISCVLATALVTSTFSNSAQYKFDTDGNAIDLTSGKIDLLGGTYVWYGLPNGCGETFCGITSYSSSDLKTWQFNGLLFDPTITVIQTLCSVPLSGNCGRPHIVYSATNEEYVLWVNAGIPGYVLFTSSSPTSGYTILPDRALVGYQPTGPFTGGDFSVQVIEGTGYIAYSLIDFTTAGASIWPPFLQSIYFQPLVPSMRNTTGNASHVVTPANDLVDFEAESPDIFKRGDWYYITASNTCGFCPGTLLIVYRSKCITGPWLRQIISADTCGGQSTGVLALPSPSDPKTSTSSSYLHVADLFSTANITGTRTASHGHQFQSLQFNSDGTVQDLDCSSARTFSFTFAPGDTTSSSLLGVANTATDGSGEDNAYTVSCNLPAYQLYQTWASSSSGNLSEVGVNIAGDNPSGNLTITVFRYTNNTNFFTPRYVWETLAARIVTPSEVSQALEVLTVPVGKEVAKGDRLGFALVSASITPMCTLVTEDTNVMFNLDTSTRSLFYIGVNQVSYRGKDGTTPPVQVLEGKELKWFAVVD